MLSARRVNTLWGTSSIRVERPSCGNPVGTNNIRVERPLCGSLLGTNNIRVERLLCGSLWGTNSVRVNSPLCGFPVALVQLYVPNLFIFRVKIPESVLPLLEPSLRSLLIYS